MIRFIDLTLNKTYGHESTEQEIQERDQMEKFLNTLREIESEYPWAILIRIENWETMQWSPMLLNL